MLSYKNQQTIPQPHLMDETNPRNMNENENQNENWYNQDPFDDLTA